MCSGGSSSDLYTVNQSNPPIIERFFEQARFKKPSGSRIVAYFGDIGISGLRWPWVVFDIKHNGPVMNGH